MSGAGPTAPSGRVGGDYLGSVAEENRSFRGQHRRVVHLPHLKQVCAPNSKRDSYEWGKALLEIKNQVLRRSPMHPVAHAPGPREVSLLPRTAKEDPKYLLKAETV